MSESLIANSESTATRPDDEGDGGYSRRRAQINGLQPIPGNGAQQPPQVDAYRIQRRVNGITVRARDSTAVVPVVRLRIPNHWLRRLSVLGPFVVLRSHRLESLTVDDLCGHQAVHDAVTDVHDRGGGFDLQVLQKISGLLDLFGNHGAVIRVAKEGYCTNDQPLLVRDGDAGLHVDFLGVADLALADALRFWRVQGT